MHVSPRTQILRTDVIKITQFWDYKYICCLIPAYFVEDFNSWMGQKIFLVSTNIHPDSVAHQASYSMSSGVSSLGSSGRSIMFTTHLYLVSRLKMTEPTHLLLLYAFMAWTEKNLHFVLYLPPSGNHSKFYRGKKKELFI